MTTPSSITFAIPFYGSAAYLADALDSVTRQTVADWRCVVVDDCSPDAGAAEVVRRTGDARISYSRNSQNLGIGGNWNRCIELVDTELVTLLHCDDRLLPNYAEIMLDVSRREPNSSAYYCQASIIDVAGEKIFSFVDWYKHFLDPAFRYESHVAGEQGLRALLHGFFIICPTLCYRRDVFVQGGAKFSDRLRQVLDMQLITDLIMSGARITGVPRVGYQYRRHEDNQTTALTRSLKRFHEEIELYDELAGRARQSGWSSAARSAEKKAIIKKNLAYCIANDLLARRFDVARDRWHLLRQLSQ